MSLLEVRDLHASFLSQHGEIPAVAGVTFDVDRGEIVGLVGESGSGKSTIALALLGFMRPPRGVVRGEVEFAGRDILSMGTSELRSLRGSGVAMVFQDPLSSLNPSLTIGRQLAEALRLDLGRDGRAIRQRSLELLAMVGLPDPDVRIRDFPHQLSGGMRQRALIALALARNPSVVIADEITTALDVTVQAQILELLTGLVETLGLGVLVITHDLGVVANIAHRVHVMYAGQFVESAATRDLFAHPQMPYTQGLLASSLRLDDPRGSPLQVIGGQPPDVTALPPGCRFEPRCTFRREVCSEGVPSLDDVPSEPPSHAARCWGLQSGDKLGWLLPASDPRPDEHPTGTRGSHS